MRTHVQNSIAISYAVLKVAELAGLGLPIEAIFQWGLPVVGHPHVSLVDAFVIAHLVVMLQEWGDDFDDRSKK